MVINWAHEFGTTGIGSSLIVIVWFRGAFVEMTKRLEGKSTHWGSRAR